MRKFRTIIADPPWAIAIAGGRKRKKEREGVRPLPYPTMTLAEICRLRVPEVATDDAHLWFWTCNQHLEDGFSVMRAWGFKYLLPIHWIKTSGRGNWFIHRTQTILFGYRRQCRFPLGRYRPNLIASNNPARHSQKPEAFFDLVESISPGPRLELFARAKRRGWSSWGNEVESDVEL